MIPARCFCGRLDFNFSHQQSQAEKRVHDSCTEYGNVLSTVTYLTTASLISFNCRSCTSESPMPVEESRRFCTTANARDGCAWHPAYVMFALENTPLKCDDRLRRLAYWASPGLTVTSQVISPTIGYLSPVPMRAWSSSAIQA